MANFATDIRPLFRDSDIEEMSFAFDLSDYDDVKNNADAINEGLSEGPIPCDGEWSEDQRSPQPVETPIWAVTAGAVVHSSRARVDPKLPRAHRNGETISSAFLDSAVIGFRRLTHHQPFAAPAFRDCHLQRA